MLANFYIHTKAEDFQGRVIQVLHFETPPLKKICTLDLLFQTGISIDFALCSEVRMHKGGMCRITLLTASVCLCLFSFIVNVNPNATPRKDFREVEGRTEQMSDS